MEVDRGRGPWHRCQHLGAEAVDDVVDVRLAKLDAAVEFVVVEELHDAEPAVLKYVPGDLVFEFVLMAMSRVLQVLAVVVEVVHTAGVPAVALLLRAASAALV